MYLTKIDINTILCRFFLDPLLNLQVLTDLRALGVKPREKEQVFMWQNIFLNTHKKISKKSKNVAKTAIFKTLTSCPILCFWR